MRSLIPILTIGFLASPAHAELRFDQPHFDAGEVRAGLPLTHRFAFVNAGTEVVDVVELRAGCGCLAPRLDKRQIQPGEQGEVTVEIRTLGQKAGPNTWTVRVVSREKGESREIPLELVGRVVTEVSVQPAELKVSAGQAVRHDILLTDLRDKPLAIVSLHSSSPRLRASLTGESKDSAGHTVRCIHIEIDANGPEGRSDEALDILTDDPVYRVLNVPVTIEKRSGSAVRAVPETVALTAPPEQELPSRLVMLREPSGRTVLVERVLVDDPAVVCRWAAGPGAMTTLRISVDRGGLAGSTLQTKVHVYLREPAGESLTIPVTCSPR